MSTVEFTDIKQLSIVSVLDMLGLKVVKIYGETRRVNCPFCKYYKSLAATPGINKFKCHNVKCGQYGSAIDLVQKVRGFATPREAALAIQAHFSDQNKTGATQPDHSATLQRILDRLLPEHEAVQALGITAETARLFESGYCPSGKQQGRYSVAVRDLEGVLVAFAGIAVTPDQEPAIVFSNFEPSTAVFNQHRLAREAELMLCPSPLEAILAVQDGAPIDSITSFLTETVCPQQLQYLAALMERLGIAALSP